MFRVVFSSALLVAGIWASCSGIVSEARAGDGSSDTSLILVRLSGLERGDWEHAHGVQGKRAYDHFLKSGQILPAGQLPPEFVDRLDLWSSDRGGNLLWLGEDVPPKAEAGGSFLSGRVPMGSIGQRVYVDWQGEVARARVLEAIPVLENALWLNRPDVVRWEEVVEILDLTRTENHAFRNLTATDHPLVRFRSTFLQDKRAASLALYLNRKHRPPFLRLELNLLSVFVGVVQPFAAELSEADARYFAARVRNSMPSVAGRVDRILQSLYAEASDDTWVVVDARDSADPFVAWVGPRYGLRTKDVLAVLPPPSARIQ